MSNYYGYDYKSFSYSRLNCLLEYDFIDKKTYDEELEFIRVSSEELIHVRFLEKGWEEICEKVKEEIIIDYETSDMIREDAIECPVCFDTRWGVRLPNCSHFICSRCYYTIYKGFMPEKFKQGRLEPIEPEQPKYTSIPEYPYSYCNKKVLKDIFDSFGINDDFKEWFVNENKDLYISIKKNTVYVEDIDDVIKEWFQNDEKINLYKNMMKIYKDSKKEYDKLWRNYHIEYEKYLKELEEYNEFLEYEKEMNIKKRCPLCRK